MTAAVTNGTFQTASLVPGAAQLVTIDVIPNKKNVSKRVRRGGRLVTVWLKKKLTLKHTSTSTNDNSKKDVYLIKVQHK